MRGLIDFYKRVEQFFSSAYKFMRFIYHYIRRWVLYGKCYYPYIPSEVSSSIRVLANGPSLTNEMFELKQSGILTNEPLFVMNFFALSDSFVELKPTRYCLADPGFFQVTKMVERIEQMYSVLNTTVSWQMNLYVPNVSQKNAQEKINNANIKIVPISTLHYQGFESLRNIFYKKGIATPSFVNVLTMIEYICLNEGFKNIYLYGADHTFLDGLVVGDDNILYIEDKHFYGSERIIADTHIDGSPWRIAEFIYDKYLTFVEHDVLRSYADYLAAKIINCTKCSLIDSYIRLSQTEESLQ